jgi:hypothetical protein
VVTICTSSLPINICTLFTNCIYVFGIYLRTNSDLCQLQNQLISFYNMDLTLYNPVVTLCTTSLIFDKCTLFPHCIYMVCICRRTNSVLWHLLHLVIGLYKIDLTLYNPVVTICTTILTFNNCTLCPHIVFMCFVFISEQRANCATYCIN